MRGRVLRVPDRGGQRELLLQPQRLARERAGERDAPRERLRHRAHDGEVRGHAGLGEAVRGCS